MSNVTDTKSKVAANNYSNEMAFDYAKRVLLLTAKHGVAPIPKNYAVWFEYVAGNNDELTRDINALIKEGAEFTEKINEALYFNHVVGIGSDVVKETTADMEKMMTDMLAALGNFSGDAAGFEKEVGAQIKQFDKSKSAEELRALIERILKNALSLRESSSGLNNKLEESRKEIENLRVKLDKANEESEKDFLTGLFNRKALDRVIDRSIEHAQKERESLCLLMLDIDHFKRFNDTYGHLIGDQVLKIVAKALKDTVKGVDVVARYGGEEFCVLLPKTPIGGALSVAENIRKTIASKDLKRRDTGETYGQITVSVGVAMFRNNSDTAISFVKRADEALYKSKQDGRNRVTREPG